MELALSEAGRQELKELIKEALGEFFHQAQQEVEGAALISLLIPGKALEIIAECSSLEELEELEEDERGRRDEGRPGILAALNVRRTELVTAQ